MNKKVLILVLSLFFSYFYAFGMNPNQPQEKKPETQLQHEVTVTLKLVQVYVTDKDGKPVTDLTKDDFILYDNGKLQTITDFERHLLLKPEKKVEEEIAKTELPPPENVPSMMNRKFFLILDMDRNNAVGISKSKKAALHFIDTQLQPTDEVGVFSYSFIRRLVVHQYLTSDHEKVKEVIRKIREVPGNLLPRDSSARGGVIITRGRDTASLEIIDITNIFIKIIKELAEALRYIPGYKNIILFSAGLQEDLLTSSEQVLLEKYEEMSKEFAASNSPVYTVNTSDAQRPLSLQMLSGLSGGRYFHDVDYYEKISAQIQDVTSNYYVLGYYINEKWDGRYHEIKVEVKRSGCIVHAQGGYFNPKPFSEFSEFEKQLHLMELALSGKPHFQEALRFPLLTLPCSNRKESNLVLLSEIPLFKIKEIIRQKTEMVTLIFDEENNIVDSSRGEVNFSIIPQDIVYHYAIKSLSPGEYKCSMVIRNIETGNGAVASSSVEIPEEIDSGIRLYPPLLLIPEKEAFYLKASVTQEEKTEEEPLSLIDIYPFLSKKYSPLVEYLEQGIKRLLVVVRCSVVNIQKPDIELLVYLGQNSSGEKILLPFHFLSSKQEEDIDILLIEIWLPDMEAGEYSLDFVAEETNTKLRSQVYRTLRVR